jgi:hypothetical protein
MKRKGALGKLLNGMLGHESGWTSSLNQMHPEKERSPQQKLKAKLQNQKNRKQGDNHESGLASMTGLSRVQGSGSGMYQLGDLANELWHLEAKSTRSGSIRFDQKWIDKARRQATRLEREYVALAIQFAVRGEEYSGPLEAIVLFSKNVGELEPLSSISSNTRTKALKQEWFSHLVDGKCIPFTTPDYKLTIITINDFKCILSTSKDQTDQENQH